MHEILAQLFFLLISLVEQFGYVGIWLGMTIESAAIPLPSEAIMGLAGYFVYQGKLNIYLAALAGAVGNITGSTILYSIGLYGGKPQLLKYGKYIGVSEDEYDKGVEWIKKYGDKAVFFAQLMPIVRTYVSLPPGVLKMDFKKFIFYTFTGAYVWCFFLAYVAMRLGSHWEDIEKYMKGFQYVIIAGILVGILWLIYYKAKKQHYKHKNK